MGKKRGRGEGSIEKLPSGNWRAEVWAGRHPDGGKPIRLKKTFRTRADAVAWKAAKRVELDTGAFQVPGRATLGEYVGHWLALKRIERKGSTADTYKELADRLILRAWPIDPATPCGKAVCLAALPLTTITPAELGRWQEAMRANGLSADRRRKALGQLRAVLKAAVRDRLIRENPAAAVPKPRADKSEMRYWTAPQVAAVVKACRGRRLGAAMVLKLDTGVRVGELLALHWPELDLDAGTVKVTRTLDVRPNEHGEKVTRGKGRKREYVLTAPKTEKARRTIRLSAVAVEFLAAHRGQMQREGRDVTTGPVFVGKRSGTLLDRGVLANRYFAGFVKAAGVPVIRTHDIRHTNATLLLASGVNVKVVSDRLGHEDVATTFRLYAHVLSEQQDQAAAAMGAVMLSGSLTPTDPPRGGLDVGSVSAEVAN